MRVQGTTVVLAGLTALLVTACSAPPSPQPTQPSPPQPYGAAAQAVLTAAGVKRQPPAPGAPTAAVIDGMTRFAHELNRVTADPDQNWVVSPLSIATGFAMARAGADGQTAAQIDRIFGFPEAGVHDAFNAVTRTLGPPARARRGAPDVRLANAVWAQHGFPVGQPFLRTLAAQYGAGLRTVDFRSPAAKEAIDAWVRTQTAERIQRLFDQLNPETKLVLANAIYFKADWEMPFGKSPTQEGIFTRADGSTVRAQMMNHQERLRYASGPDWQAVELTFRGRDYAMWVLVPAAGKRPAELLAPGVLSGVAAGLKPASVDLALPRWEFDTDIDLLKAVKTLGLTDVHGFAGIHPDLFLDQAVHRATITVNEKGTEAAAMTGLAFAVSGPPIPEVTVRADRPFTFAVVHTPTRTPVFVGTVADPTA